MEYNIGDRFVVVDNTENIHFFSLGEVVTYRGKGFGEYLSFTNGAINQGLPAVDVVSYYDLGAMIFNHKAALEGDIDIAFLWDYTPEGVQYWQNQYFKILTPKGQEKLDSMIKLYEFYQSRNTLVDAPAETVLDIKQELEDWVNDFDEVTGSSVKDGVICKPKLERGTPDGGPQTYYDLPPDAVTLNDLIEFKSYNQWLGDTAHLFNIFKAAWRWGIKEGTSKEYDARKFIYSGARLLMHYAGVEATRETLQKMLDDKQFGGRG